MTDRNYEYELDMRKKYVFSLFNFLSFIMRAELEKENARGKVSFLSIGNYKIVWFDFFSGVLFEA